MPWCEINILNILSCIKSIGDTFVKRWIARDRHLVSHLCTVFWIVQEYRIPNFNINDLIGKIDLVKSNAVVTKDPTQNASLTSSKTINHISIQHNLAYLSCDYGVAVFDLARGEVKETWRDIGAGGTTVKIFKTTFKDDSIFLATDKGVFAGDLKQNLMDFNFRKVADALIRA